MKDFIVMKALAIVVPVLIGPIVYIITQQLKRVWGWLDTLPPAAKRGTVLGIAITLAAASQVAGLMLPAECSAIGTGALTSDCQSALASPVFLKGIIGAAIAFLLHYMKKADPAS